MRSLALAVLELTPLQGGLHNASEAGRHRINAAVAFVGETHLNRDFFYGSAFGLIAVSIFATAFRGGWYLFACWPALSFGIVSIAYLTSDARWFGKRKDGTRSWLPTAVLLPYLVFVHGVWLLQISLSPEPAISYVNNSLALSRRLRAHELPDRIGTVCDLTCEFVDPKAARTRPGYCCHPILDAGTCTAAELIDLAKRLPPRTGDTLLIHCANGHGRTAMFAAVWLLTHGFVTSVDDAIKTLQTARPGVRLRARQRRLIVETWVFRRSRGQNLLVRSNVGGHERRFIAC